MTDQEKIFKMLEAVEKIYANSLLMRDDIALLHKRLSAVERDNAVLLQALIAMGSAETTIH